MYNVSAPEIARRQFIIRPFNCASLPCQLVVFAEWIGIPLQTFILRSNSLIWPSDLPRTQMQRPFWSSHPNCWKLLSHVPDSTSFQQELRLLLTLSIRNAVKAWQRQAESNKSQRRLRQEQTGHQATLRKVSHVQRRAAAPAWPIHSQLADSHQAPASAKKQFVNWSWRQAARHQCGTWQLSRLPCLPVSSATDPRPCHRVDYRVSLRVKIWN